MTTLKEIKKHKDKFCTKSTLNKVNLIKKACKTAKNQRVWALGNWNRREYFVSDDKIYIVQFTLNQKKELALSSLYSVTLKEDNAIDFKVIIPETYTEEEFKIWYNSPCTTTEMVDVANFKAIKFLQNYKKNTFKTENYLFYVKRDKDFTWADNFYAYDIKNKAELKIYLNSYIETFIPQKEKDVFIEVVSGELSVYQLRKCKKEFMHFIKEICPELEIENFYALEFIKQALQPIEKDRGWFVDKIFSGDFEFQNIWIDNKLIYDGEPYFLVVDGVMGNIKHIATLDFFKPEYKSKEPYISGYFKRNHWEIDKNTLKQLVAFLKEPFDYTKTHLYRKYKRELDAGDIKTNWQWLISEYNSNTGIKYGELPLDLEIPDYTLIGK